MTAAYVLKIFMIMDFLFSGHGFGINTNILDTNVINLAVVVAIVISVLGDALRDLLGNRKKTILTNLNAADKRAQEVLEAKREILAQADMAKREAREIYDQISDAVQREKKACIEQADEECLRLKQLKGDRLRFQQQKATQHIAQQIIVLSVDEAQQVLEKRAKSRRSQIWINTKKMTYYVTIQKYKRLLF